MKSLTLSLLLASSALPGLAQTPAPAVQLQPLVIISSQDQVPCAVGQLHSGDHDSDEEEDDDDDDDPSAEATEDDDGCLAGRLPAAPARTAGKPPKSSLFNGAPSAVVN